jgi:hypothetical protein
MANDHLNVIERQLIDTLRSGNYNTTAGIGSGSAWVSGNVTVFGQFPDTDEVEYPCIVIEMVANGMEEQFMGQDLTYGASNTAAIGELYGVGFNLYLMVDRDSSLTPVSAPYRQRRLLNYLMLNCANVLMDCDFTGTDTEVEQRLYTGFRNIGYEPMLEVWAAVTGMVVVFKNTRG